MWWLNLTKNLPYLEFRILLSRKLTNFDVIGQEIEEKKELDAIPFKYHKSILTDTKRRCIYCKYQGIDSNSKYKCSICDVFLHSSGKECFNLYHNPNS